MLGRQTQQRIAETYGVYCIENNPDNKEGWLDFFSGGEPEQVDKEEMEEAEYIFDVFHSTTSPKRSPEEINEICQHWIEE